MQWLVRVLLYTDAALWLGASIYFLLATLQLFHGLPIDTAAKAVGLLFPGFFGLSVALAIIGWALYVIYLRLQRDPPLAWAGHLAAGLSTLIALLERFYFLPSIERLEKLMGPISQASTVYRDRFGVVHGISFTLELMEIALVLVLWLILSRQSMCR